jgi:hypothetical protein
LQIEYLSMSLAQRRRSRSARACAACAPRVAPSFLKWIRRRRTLNIQYSIENIQLFMTHKTAPLVGLDAVLIDVFFLMTLRAVIHLHAIP